MQIFSHRLRAGVSFLALAPRPASSSGLRARNIAGAFGMARHHYLSLTAAVAALGIMATSPSHAQAPPVLGTVLPTFGVLAGSTVTNTGPTTITGTAALPGNVGVSPGNTFTGSGSVTFATGGVQHLGDATAAQAQFDLGNAYSNLAGRPTTVNLTGQDLGGLTLVPGVYNFSSSAQLTGTLRLNALGNPNAVFIFNIASTLTTASASVVSLINGAQGGNVFWRVGSSATLGTSTSFAGNILAQASITLTTGVTITCGAAWAQTAAVTLDTNAISLCDLISGGGGTGAGGGGTPLGPTGVPLFAFLLPSSANGSQRAVAIAIDTSVGNGATLPLAFLNFFELSPTNLAAAFSQLQGEAGTGVAQAGTQAMNSFLSLVTNPFNDNRAGFVESPPPPRSPLVYYKARPYQAPDISTSDPRRWSIWAAGYGGENKTTGDPVVVGSHNRSANTVGYATGLDYRITPHTLVGFALAGGGTNYGLAEGYGGGHSDMFQSAVYSISRFGAAYVSAALAYAWHRVSTDRFLSLVNFDHLSADFSAHDFGGRIEGGYRFGFPGVFGLPGFGFTPYGALQAQAFHTPYYNEQGASGSSDFALGYNARTINTSRTELGSWFDQNFPFYNGTVLALRTRAAWAHDNWSDPSVNAFFQSLPGSNFTEFGAAPAHDSLLASANAEISFQNGFSFATRLDTELAENSKTYAAYGRLRYTW